MADTTLVRLNPPRLRLKAGEQASVTVTVVNYLEQVEHYRLYVEGGEPGWFEFDRVQVSAFPMEETPPARLRIHLPQQLPGAVYNLTVWATSQTGENQGRTTLQLEVPSAAVAAPPPVQRPLATDPRVAPAGLPLSPQILLSANPASSPDVLPPALAWQLTVHNAGRVLNTFSYCLVGIPASWAVIEPPQLILKPGETGQSMLKVRPGASAPPGPYPFVLRVFSHLNISERTEIGLQIAVTAENSMIGNTLIREKSSVFGSTLPQKAVSPGEGQLEISASTSSLSLAAGGRGQIDLTLRNNNVPELPVELNCQGLPESWVSLRPPSAIIPPRNTAQGRLTLAPLATIPQGSYPFSLVVAASYNPDLTVSLPMVLEITEAGLAKSTAGVRSQARTGAAFDPEASNSNQPRILLSVDKPTISVPPGASGELQIGIQNLTTRLDAVSVRVEGLTKGWVQIIQNDLTVFPQGQSSARVIIQPPQEPTVALAGRYPLRFKAKSQENAGAEGEAKGELEVQLVGDYRLNLKKTEERGIQEATYPLQVVNKANAPLRLVFKIARPDEALWYKFDPPEVNVPSGGEVETLVSVKPKRGVNKEQLVTFNIVTEGEFLLKGDYRLKAPAYQATGRFTQDVSTPLRVTINPPQAQARDSQPSVFDVQVSNPSPVWIKASLAGADRNQALQYRFEPAEVRLPPNGEGRLRLTVIPLRAPAPGQQLAHAFRVTARSNEIAAGSGWADVNLLQITAVAAPQQFPAQATGFNPQATRFTPPLPVAVQPPPPVKKKNGFLKWLLALLALLIIAALVLAGLVLSGILVLPFGGTKTPTAQAVNQLTPTPGQISPGAGSVVPPTTLSSLVTVTPAIDTKTTVAAPATTPAVPTTTPPPDNGGTATAQFVAGQAATATSAANITAQVQATATAAAAIIAGQTATAKAQLTGQAITAGVSEAGLRAKATLVTTPVSSRVEISSTTGIDFYQIILKTSLLNFTAEATFKNPYDINTGPWAYGFLFHFTSLNRPHYRLFIDSDNIWQLQYINPTNVNSPLTVVQKGTFNGLKVGVGEFNKLYIVVSANFGYFFINDALVDILELRGTTTPGGVAVATGFIDGYKHLNSPVLFINFKVSSLPGNPPVTPVPGATPPPAGTTQLPITFKPIFRTPQPTYTPSQ